MSALNELLLNSIKIKQSNRTSKVAVDKPTDFLIANDWLKHGHAEITSNNETVMNMVLTGGKKKTDDCQLTINNIDGKPLLYMKQDGRMITLSDSELSSTPICKIARKLCKLTIHNRYEVQIIGPTALKYSPDISPFSIDCKGHWPKSFTFEATHSGEQLASVQKTIVQNWQLHVLAGEDILLFIGIACAIDLINQNSTHSLKKIPVVKQLKEQPH